MPNTDIRVQVTFPAHWKTRKLERLIGDAGPKCLVYLWCYAGANKPRGYFEGMNDEEIEDAAYWAGEAGKFIEALIASGFMEGEEMSRSLHDWEDHNGWCYRFPDRSKQSRINRSGKVKRIKKSLKGNIKTLKGEGKSLDSLPFPSSPSLPSPPPSQDKSSGKPEPSLKSIGYVRQLFPDVKENQLNAQAITLDEIERIDGANLGEVAEALRWAVEDEFWSRNFLSCAGLRKRRNGKGDAMKWQKIKAAYNKANQDEYSDDFSDIPPKREEMKVPYICTKCGGKFKVTRYKDEPDDRIFRPENCPDCSQDLVTKGTLRHDPDRGGHNG